MAQRKKRWALPLLLLIALVAALRTCCQAFVGLSLRGRPASLARHAGLLDGLGNIADLAKDPEKMKKIQAETEAIMKDPAKRKQFEEYSQKMMAQVDKLKEDPELKGFFEDVEKNGFQALNSYEKDGSVMQKLSGVMGNMVPEPGTFKPGDEVVIKGLTKAPQLNGKRALIVPATPDETATIEGTDRLVVRLVEEGDQFAIKKENLLSAYEASYTAALEAEADKLRDSGKLEELQNDPELMPIFKDIEKNGMEAMEKYWKDEKVMAKISEVMQS